VIFPIIFGLFELLLIVGTLQYWLLVTRLRVEIGRLMVAEGYIIPGRERSFGAEEISDVSLKISMQAGSRPYYDLIILRKQGKPVTAGRWIRDKREAEWLAHTVREAIGLKPETAGAAVGNLRARSA
jgi:hypothetical protein